MTRLLIAVTAEMIEHAARALWDEPGWEHASPEQRQHHREAAERVLEAAAPLIAAQVLREAAEVAQPFYPAAGQFPVTRDGLYNWLLDRADQIEDGR